MVAYVALLRGINVGGNNLIPMAALRAAFEAAGHGDVRTYIQSGNVLFTSPRADAAALTRDVEAMLRTSFGYDATVVLRSRRQFESIVRTAPVGFGDAPADYRYDVVFLKPPLRAAAAVPLVETHPDVDVVVPGPRVLYFRRLEALASRSRLNRITSSPIYRQVTIRNWNTTTRLAAMLAG